MNYFTVRKYKDTAQIINPKGQVFCEVNMGPDVYEILTEKRALVIANLLNKAKLNDEL